MSFNINAAIELFDQHVNLDYVVGTILGLGVAMLMVHSILSGGTKQKKTDTPKAHTVFKKFTGTWKSKIFDVETGTFEIKLWIPQKDGDRFTANVDMVYSNTSQFKPGIKVLIEFDCEYDEWHKSYILKSQEPIDGQHFLIHFKKNTNTYPTGHLTCIQPADLCELTFDKTKK